MNISEAWKLYELDKRIEGYSLHTLKAYLLQSKLLIKRFSDINIKEITFEQLKMYILELTEAGRKPSTII